MDNSIFIVALAMLCTGGLLYAVAYPYLAGEAKREQRTKAMRAPVAKRGDRTVDVAKRRAQIIESLKDLDKKSKRKKTFQDRLNQAGLAMTPQKFALGSAGLGIVLGVLVYIMNDDLMMAGVAAVVGGVGIPQWLLRFLFKRRMKKFIIEFPNAVDVIIRGVKAGLPLNDCVRIIAAEAAEPVRSEFRRIVEGQAIGLSVPESVERLHDSVPLPEANFFAIVINLQSKSGGNLSEALGNLSRVLRDRKKMAMKIRAMSSEAKTSAGIIACMPFLVAFAVWMTTPDYVSILWTTTSGRIVLGCCAAWMSIGVFVMRKLINFDF